MDTRVGDVEGFRVGWREMLPRVCGGCGYSLKELPEPRCPECGERVEVGEVVIVGTAIHAHRRDTISNSFAKDLIYFAGAAVIAGGLLLGVYGVSPVVLGVSAGIFGLLTCISILNWVNRKVMGRPTGVLRLSAAGYCSGTGRSVGRRKPWGKGVRFEVVRRGVLVEVRGVRVVRRVPLWTVFGVYAVWGEVQVEGVLERVRAWGGGDVEVRRRGWE